MTPNGDSTQGGQTAVLPPIAEVTQTFLAVEDDATVPGNCLQAAVAAALGLPIDAVPHLGTFAWWDTAMKLWLRGRGLDARQVHVPPIPDQRCIVTGKAPRGVYHAVVGEHGEIAWDPHPTRGGLVEVLAAWVIEEWPTPESDKACLVCRSVSAPSPAITAGSPATGPAQNNPSDTGEETTG